LLIQFLTINHLSKMTKQDKRFNEVQALLDKYQYPKKDIQEIEISTRYSILDDISLLTYCINIRSKADLARFIYSSGDSFKSALHRLEIGLSNKDYDRL
ncbi:MAG: hypothetical protein ACK41O_26480, partial [Runella zeae]